MERLTEKRGNFYYDLNECMISDCSNKLGQYEDIEDELGIDLITLFKALKNGIYTNIDCCLPYWTRDFELDYNEDENRFKLLYFGDVNNYPLSLKDYGKTWALTKEELEKWKD